MYSYRVDLKNLRILCLDCIKILGTQSQAQLHERRVEEKEKQRDLKRRWSRRSLVALPRYSHCRIYRQHHRRDDKESKNEEGKLSLGSREKCQESGGFLLALAVLNIVTLCHKQHRPPSPPRLL